MFNHRALRVWIMPGPRRSSGLSLCDCSHPNTWNVGVVKGVTSFALVVCSLRAIWTFSMNNFLIHKFRIKKCILLIKLMCYNNNQRFYLQKMLSPLCRGFVFEQVDTPSTHIYTIQVTLALRDTGRLISWQAMNKAPTILKTDKCEDLPLLAEENVTK